MKFNSKPKDDQDLAKALFELYKKDSSLFVKGRPGETKINEEFIKKIVNKVQNNQD